MPLFPRLFSNTFRFSPLQNQTTVLPKAALKGSERLEHWQTLLNDGADLLNDYHQTGGHSLPGAKEYKNRQEQIARQLKQDELTAFKPLMQDALLAKQANQFFTTHELFRQPSTWDSLDDKADSLPQKNQLNRLKQHWMRHAPYSHFSPEGLLNAARCIEKIRFVLEQLKKEAPRYAVYEKEKKTLHAYQEYLKNYENNLNAQQNYIAESLAARIVSALNAKDLNHHEPLSSLYKELKQTNPHTLLPEFRPLESTFPLARAVNYCMIKGNIHLREFLQQALRLSQNDRLTVIRQGKERLLIPQSMANLIPAKPAFFTRFSPGHQLRYEFFKTRQELLFKMAALHRPSVGTPTWELDDSRWYTLEQLSDQINEALQQAQEIPVGKWFNKKRSEFTRQWTALLQEQKTEIISQKLRYLSELADTPQPLHWASSYNDDSEERAKINLVLDAIDAAASTFNTHHQATWRQLKHKLERRQLPSDAICLLNNAVLQIQAGNILPKYMTNKLTMEFQLMDQHNKNTFKAHSQEYEAHLQNILLQQLATLELAIDKETSLSDPALIHQTLDLLRCINKVADTHSDFSACYSKLLSIFTNFKALSRQLTLEEVQNSGTRELNTLLSRIAFSNENWSELQELMDDAETYQNDILEGRTPMTFEEIEEDEKQIDRQYKLVRQENSQRHNAFIDNAHRFIKQIKDERIATNNYSNCLAASDNSTHNTEEFKFNN